MKLKLKRVEPLQAGKLLGALYGSLGLLMVPFIMVFMGVGAIASSGRGNAAPLPVFLGAGVGFMLLLPLFYAAMGFVMGALGALLYNLFARWLGGLAVEFESVDEPPAR